MFIRSRHFVDAVSRGRHRRFDGVITELTGVRRGDTRVQPPSEAALTAAYTAALQQRQEAL